MRASGGASTARGWTIMLADIVALMLAFFVLGFSMRVLVPSPGAPLVVAEDATAALAALERWSTESLTTAGRPSGPMPPFPYLAALLDRLLIEAPQASVRHDESRLMLTLDGDPSTTAEGGGRRARDLLLAMAFLARRFDLDLSVTMPGRRAEPLATQLSRAQALQARLSAATRHVAPEVILAPATTLAAVTTSGDGLGPAAARWQAELRRRPMPAAAADRQ